MSSDLFSFYFILIKETFCGGATTMCITYYDYFLPGHCCLYVDFCSVYIKKETANCFRISPCRTSSFENVSLSYQYDTNRRFKDYILPFLDIIVQIKDLAYAPS